MCSCASQLRLRNNSHHGLRGVNIKLFSHSSSGGWGFQTKMMAGVGSGYDFNT